MVNLVAIRIGMGIFALTVIALIVIGWVYVAWPMIEMRCKRRGDDPYEWLKKQSIWVAYFGILVGGLAIAVFLVFWVLPVCFNFFVYHPWFVIGLCPLLLLLPSKAATSTSGTSAGTSTSGTSAGTSTSRASYFRVTHCYNCKILLTSRLHVPCSRCGWLTCPKCGACGCGYGGW